MSPEDNFRILVVTGEAAISRTISTYLRVRGYDCSTAFSLGEAISWVESNTAHIILIDLDLAGVDGLNLVERIRNQCDLSQIIAMSAQSSVDKIIDVFRLGASDYLPMPFKKMDDIGVAVAEAAARLVKWRGILETTLSEEGR